MGGGKGEMDMRPLDLGTTLDANNLTPPALIGAPPSKLGREKAARRPLIDPLSLAGTLFFLAAVAAAAYPAFKAGATTGPSLLLLVGLAGVALAGVVVFGLTDREEARRAERPTSIADALIEAACVVRPDGRIVESNLAWRSEMGSAARLPRAAMGGPALYSALTSARRDGAAEAQVQIADQDRMLLVSRLNGEQLLVRIAREAVREPALLSPPQAVDAPPMTAATPASALDAFAAAAPFGAALLDGAEPFDGVVVQANAALQAIAGGAARPGVRFGELLDPAGLDEAKMRLRAKRGGPVEVKMAGGGAKTAHLYVTAAEGRLTVFLLDVTDQKQLEAQLVQSQKMQAIGQLAGGVAHDFNNLLTAIQLRLDELLQRHPVGDPSYEGLNEIRQTGTRAADLVRKLLAFSRKQTVQRETLELGELISEFEVLLRRLLREDVKLITDYGRNLPQVRADKSALETAVMNLAVNARDALRSHGAADDGVGVVRIRTARLSQAEARTLGYPDASSAGAALIEVADNGPGIPPEVMANIFEPFFTTKPVGEGTGLGLATVYGIVKQADGWIHVESRPGQGAAFRVFLPIHIAATGGDVAVRSPLKFKPTPRDLSGAGRILFVEDEDAVRVVAARLLRARGYEVIEAADGEEALALAEQHAGEIDLLISDVIMPGLDGPTLLKKARPFLGDAQVMFISGYAEAEFSDILEGEEGVTFLPKPIDIKILAERVKQQLQAG
jgi:two-component system cell cycle sensor histidine kinase/response regulator CckA